MVDESLSGRLALRAEAPAETRPAAPSLSLKNGAAMPMIGLGTWPMDDEESARAVEQAIQIGYRHVDTAENYENEAGVGEGIRRSGIPRNEIFITTKFNRGWHSSEGVVEAFENSIARLGVDYLDLFMIHWPNPELDNYVDAFRGLEVLRREGRVRAVGVANFKKSHLQRLFDADFTPEVNQIQIDPEHVRNEQIEFHERHGIVTAAYSPLGRGGAFLRDASIASAAAHHRRTPSQIVLRWHTQKGVAAVPKSADPSRQLENLNIFDFRLTPDQMRAIDALDTGGPARLDSDSFGH